MIPPTSTTPTTEQDRVLLFRRKSAMVLYELEMALGEFVRSEKLTTADLPTEAVTKIQLREEAAGRVLDASTPSGVIAATYLGEALALAHDVAKGRPEEEHLTRLKQLFRY
jgi:hypothetical protein